MVGLCYLALLLLFLFGVNWNLTGGSGKKNEIRELKKKIT
jgi:hypothetical protein